MDLEKKIEHAWKKTEILRQSRQLLFTFGDTELPYYVLAESLMNAGDTVVRRGEVVVQKPMIVAPPWQRGASVEGFSSEGEACVRLLVQRAAYIPPYRYRNQAQSMAVQAGGLSETAERIGKKLEEDDDRLVAVIKGDPDLWEVSVMRYCIERMVQSTPHNIQELRERGFLPFSRD